MRKQFISHARQNVVAYIALMFSVIGGGGGYALAATTHHQAHRKRTALVACASRRSGELFLHHRGKCAKGRHKLRWSIRGPRGRRGPVGTAGPVGATGATGATGPAGAPSPSIYAGVTWASQLSGIQPAAEKGMTVARTGVGTYTATITDATCATGQNVPAVTATDYYDPGEGQPPTGVVPVAFLDGSEVQGSFTIHTGYDSTSGTYVAQDADFTVVDTCLPAGPLTAGASRR